MSNVPALMITFGRLEYTKKALSALIKSDCGKIFIIDNGSTDNTKEFLQWFNTDRCTVSFNLSGVNSIAKAMNMFLEQTKGYEFCAKIDNDTLIPKNFCEKMLPHMDYADVVQARHHIIPATNPEGWHGFTKNMKKENGLLYNHFVGGSGIIFRRSVVTSIPETDSPLGGWRHFQRLHPELRKAFAEDVEIELLDQHGYGDYPEYYKTTGRC